MNNAIQNLFQICFSTISGLFGSIAGLITATGVWHTAEFEHRKVATILTYILIYAFCIIFASFFERRNGKSN